MMRSFFIIFLTCISVYCSAQNAVNEMDGQGKRHGYWTKNFDHTDQPRYEGQFNHGKETGLFKYYTLLRGKSVLSATKEFNETNNTAKVQFLSSTGKLISEGLMDGKRYIGTWLYYHNKEDAIMIKEYYNTDGKLEGERQVFYENSKIAETSHYKNGQLNGVSKWFSESGILLKEFHYLNDELHGPAKYYDADGKLLTEGQYTRDAKSGLWNYYKDGEVYDTKDFTKYSKNPKKQ